VPIFVETTIRFCPDCAQDVEFERPPCEDGHAGECPEWCCVECGCAVFVGALGAVGASGAVRAVEQTLVREVRGAA
jgi:hypothetical protein